MTTEKVDAQGSGLSRRSLTKWGAAAAALTGLYSAMPLSPQKAFGAPDVAFGFPCDEHRVSDNWADHRARGSAGGTDYIAGYGSEVRAMANGTVTVAQTTTSNGTGRYIRINHGSMGPFTTVQTDSMHLSAVLVSVGQTVSRGQVIARSGASGYGSEWYYGPHLHISGIFDGVNRDIEPYVRTTSNADATSLIYALYEDILNRTPDEGGLRTWRGYLVDQGWPVLTVANAILYSDEYYLQRIDAAYREILKREPDADGRADWLRRMQTKKVSVDEIRLNFTMSLEYYLQAGGTDETFVNVLYSTMLQRSPSAGDVADWVARARSYGGGYVVNAIWNSYESGTIRLNTIYRTFLKRDVDSSGISSWVPLITRQGDQAARSALVGSLEYLLQARARFPQG
jgi:hypothetical protein